MNVSTLPVALILLLLTISPSFGAGKPEVTPAYIKSLWIEFKTNFIQSDGRVIDRQQQDISHSESQGYGMLCSVFHNDRTTFDAIWDWTKVNLKAREDNLLTWSWGKRQNGQWGVIDYNNATDGDILVAYALINASERWSNPEYKVEAIKIIEGLRKGLVIDLGDEAFLLPAYYGFHRDDGSILNPSYIVLPAYKKFAEVDNKSVWEGLYRDGKKLLQRCTFGKMQLLPDWILLRKSGPEIWAERSPYFGYEAIRILLYQSWESVPAFPSGTDNLFSYYEKNGFIPVTIDLVKNQASLEDAPAGFYAVFAKVAMKTGRETLALRLLDKAVQKAQSEKGNYYSMSLFLLALSDGER